MIELEKTADGVILPVRAQPGSRRNEFRGIQDGSLKVCVTQIAEKGKANKAICKLLCRELGLKKSQVELVSGATSPNKKFLIRDIDLASVAQKLSLFD